MVRVGSRCLHGNFTFFFCRYSYAMKNHSPCSLRLSRWSIRHSNNVNDPVFHLRLTLGVVMYSVLFLRAWSVFVNRQSGMS